MASRTWHKKDTYYARNREKVLARLRAQRDAAGGERRKHALWKRVSKQPWSNALRSARNRARHQGVAFDLTPEWAMQRYTGRCEMTNMAFRKGGSQAGPWSLSLDRVVPSRGYTKRNCRFVLNAVNMMKSNGTDTDVFKIARALAARAAPSRIT